MTKLKLVAAKGKAAMPAPGKAPASAQAGRKPRAPAHVPPAPLALLRAAHSNALALLIDGKLAWRSGQPRMAGDHLLPEEWSVLSTDQESIHAVLQRTGLFDQLISQLGAAMEKRRGPPKVWVGDAQTGGFVSLKFLLSRQ